MRHTLAAASVLLVVHGCGGAAADWDDPWLDAKGRTVRPQVVSTFPGARHCDEQSIVFLHIGLPPGTPADTDDPAAPQYVRDAVGRFREGYGKALTPFDDQARLPPDARYTGYHTERGDELWISRSEIAGAVYIVSDGSAERWPRLSRKHYCN